MANRKSAPRLGPKALTGSLEAKRQAVVLLEVLSGAKGTQQGSESLGISLNRYYQLETRALQGLIAALEPRPKGKQRTAEQRLAEQERENRRLVREVSRHQALLRAARRSLGLKQPSGSKLKDKPGTKSTRRRRRKTAARATKAIAALRSTLGAAADAAPGGGCGGSKPGVPGAAGK